MNHLSGLLVGLLSAIITSSAVAKESSMFFDKNPAVYIFYSADCQQCGAARKFFEKRVKQVPSLRVVELDVGLRSSNDILKRFYANIDVPGFDTVPLIVVGGHFQIGYADVSVGDKVMSDLAKCRKTGCEDFVGPLMNELNQLAPVGLQQQTQNEPSGDDNDL